MTGDTRGGMLAVVKVGPGADSVRLEVVDRPTALPGTAIVRVIATGICGTDVHIADDEYACAPPVVMGHEILGEVVSTGDDADVGWIGARVACETYYTACEACEWCRDGQRNLCPDRRSIGSFVDGGFASHVRVPVLNLHRLPAGLGELDGVLSEPLACVTHCLMDPPVVNSGDRVLVTGPGAMGQLAAQVARAMGAVVTMAGLPKDADRLAIASGFGSDTITGAAPADTFDVVIECSGTAPGAASALAAAKRGGRYVQVGIFGREVTLPFDTVLYKELTVSSGFASTPQSWRRAMALLEHGLVTLGPLVTRRVLIGDWALAFAAAQAGEGIKTVVTPA